MHTLSGTLTPRFLAVLLAVLVVLMLLTILFLVHMHPGGTTILVQSTDSILDELQRNKHLDNGISATVHA